MSTDLSQNQLEELVVGKNQIPSVVFYEKAQLNVEESKKENRRIYQTLVYIQEKQAGVTDWTPQIAKPHHFKTYPDEYQDFLNSKSGVKSPSLDIIPNITPAELQEFLDLGVTSIKQLAEAEVVPPHLSHVQKSAMILESVLTEQNNVHKESHEESSEATRSIPESRATQSSYESYGGETKDVPAPDRQDNAGDIGQCRIPDSIAESSRKAAQRLQADRRINNSSPRLDSNWSISIGG